ncbi:MAG: hypothetical protein RL701_3986, partial [Pseudomonadota bacterium]
MLVVGSKDKGSLVVTPTPIEDVSERVRDFTRALREAGAEDIAQRIDGYAGGFVDSTQVRRSVDAIRQQLRYFRAYPEELPDLPVIQIAANRLEDACKDALRAGLIEPARLSLRAQSKRTFSVVFGTLFSAGLLVLVPFALVFAGIDVEDLWRGRVSPLVRVQKGSYVSAPVQALEATGDVRATQGVEFSVSGGCPVQLARGASCHASGLKSFGSLELQAYEVMLPDEAYGIQVAFTDAHLLGAVGRGQVLISAGPETPEGVYQVPLAAAFLGYAPAHCSWYLQLLSRCTQAQSGPKVRSEEVPVATLPVRVVPARHTPAELVTQQNVEQRKRIDERAAQIVGAVKEIQAVLDDTQSLLQKKRFESVQERIDKLTHLFEPLDASAVAGTEGEALPIDVVALRARFEAERKELAAFRDRAFESAYLALSAPHDKALSDDRILARVAQQLGVSPAFMDQIYAEHAEQLEQRLQQVAA